VENDTRDKKDEEPAAKRMHLAGNRRPTRANTKVNSIPLRKPSYLAQNVVGHWGLSLALCEYRGD
jgi:hypothetical protein